ncbi:MAG TPA: acyl carrier protein [Candidatus Omnitrophota bacterium]|nr:acyl carrier protein [Candidatus Omnitrophota bacterium]HPD84792.1 acyl carrier protein [Candidatus Omnitrophota bacterium]HRZ03650.1 acyl carrier protein [Candidatus Omnitrophota bacterium]
MDAQYADIKNKIRQYIIGQYKLNGEDAVDETANLFEEGVIDSLGAFDLAAFLEATFKVKFQEEHFFDKKFRSIEGMVSLITEIKKAESTHEADARKKTQGHSDGT